jgi:pimeloyl-ACP methyl ester carboxylesterase
MMSSLLCCLHDSCELFLCRLSMSIWQDPKVQSCFAFMVVATLGFHLLLLQERRGRKSEWWPWMQETQCQDVLDVIKGMYGHETPAMILVGHSMGGAVSV